MPELLLDEEEVIEALTPYAVRCMNGDVAPPQDGGKNRRIEKDDIEGRIIQYDDSDEEGKVAVVFRIREGASRSGNGAPATMGYE